MLGVIFGLYGLICYAIFFVTFLYAVAFVGDLPVAPKTIGTGAPGPWLATLAIDALLLGLFAVQHSVMARPGFKRWWTRFVPPPIERSTYVLFASLALIVLFAFWRPLPQTIWSVHGPAAIALLALSWLGWGVVLVSTFLINHFELFGLRQVWDRLRRRPARAPQFVTPWLYKIVRHPLYLGFILAFWATPRMSLGHLIFALGTLGHILVAIRLEEADLVEELGDRYRVYRRQVGMLVPRLGPLAKETREV